MQHKRRVVIWRKIILAYVKFIPYGKKYPEDVETTTTTEQQLWAEFSVLRHIKGKSAIYGKLVTAPWIDQAKTYFLDACGSNWNSAGLLYYYSFLNLAKALIVKNRSIPGGVLKSTSIYHGLTASMQQVKDITEFEIEVHPATAGRMKNVFAVLYKNITGQKWPFRDKVTMKVFDFLDYCEDISYEVHSFYGVYAKIINVQSLIRSVENKMWFEILLPTHYVQVVSDLIGDGVESVLPGKSATTTDLLDWQQSYDLNFSNVEKFSFIRFAPKSYTRKNKSEIFKEISSGAEKHLQGLIKPLPKHLPDDDYWSLLDPLTINGKTLPWHPLLSDYLMAFVLSSILRYQPHLFSSNPRDSFLAEAWCSQSAITTLRYFLMEFTDPPLRIN